RGSYRPASEFIVGLPAVSLINCIANMSPKTHGDIQTNYKRRQSVFIQRLLAAASLILSALAIPISAHAQTWPDKPVKIVVPYPPGGNTDNQARMIAQEMTAIYHQQFIVENKPGANG